MSNKDEILIYGFAKQGQCPYCDRAKAFLESKGLEFTYKDVNLNKEELRLKRGLDNLKGQTVPQIFINGEYIGGYTDLKTFL